MSAPYFDRAQALFACPAVDPTRRSCSTCGGANSSWTAAGSCPAAPARWTRRRAGPRGQPRPGAPVVVACAHGHNRSQRVAAHLRSEGFAAVDPRRRLRRAGSRPAFPWSNERVGRRPRRRADLWITRRRPEDRPGRLPVADRAASSIRGRVSCSSSRIRSLPWRRSEGAIAYDLPGAPFEHDGRRCAPSTRCCGPSASTRIRTSRRSPGSCAAPTPTGSIWRRNAPACSPSRSASRPASARTTMRCCGTASWSTTRFMPGCGRRARSGTTGRAPSRWPATRRRR